MYANRIVCVGVLLLATVLFHLTSLAQSDQHPSRPGNPQTETEKPSSSLKNPTTKIEDGSKTKQKSQDDLTVKLNTSLVNVPVIVTDRDGKYIPNLTSRYFQIYEENVKQSIDSFISIAAPFNVVLLIDTSGSTRFKLEEIQKSALAFIEQLREQDRVMIVSFDSDIYVESEFTNNRRKIREAILQTQTGGATRLYDAVDLVLTQRLNKVNGRKAIVLFSDGVDTASRLATAPSTIDLVQESDVLLYVIQYDTIEDVRGGIPVIVRNGSGPPIRGIPRRGTSPEDYRVANIYLREIADSSGARLYKVEMLGDVNLAFQMIADELRQQYMISYYPSNDRRDGSYRRIRVVVDRPNVAVRARKGYRAENEQ